MPSAATIKKFAVIGAIAIAAIALYNAVASRSNALPSIDQIGAKK